MIMISRYFILISLALCAHGMKLHEHMTKQEIESTFNCDHRLVHEVEYEVTPVLHVDELSNQGRAVPRFHSSVHLRAFDKNISLYLLENDNVLLGSHTPLFTANSIRRVRSVDGQPKVVYSRRPFPVPEGLKLYHDMENRAAVTVFTDDNNQAHVYGTVGDDYVIKPIPKRLHEEVLPSLPEFYQSSYSYTSQNSFSGTSYQPTPHFVIKPTSQMNPAYYDPNTGPRVNTQQQTHNLNPGDSNNPSDAAWNTFKQLNYNPLPLLQPFAPLPQVNNWPHLFNPATMAPLLPPAYGVPSRQPEPKLPITRRPTFKQPVTPPSTPVRRIKPVKVLSETIYPELLITTDHKTFQVHGSDLNETAKYMAAFWNAVDLRFRELIYPMIRLNIAGLIVPLTTESAPYFVNSGVNGAYIDGDTVSKVGEYFSHEEKFPNTTYDLTVAMSYQDLGYFSNGQFHNRVTGIAKLGGACKVKAGAAAAVVRDKGGFNGITTAAHELGHLMGAPHDSPDSDNLWRGFHCSPDYGYLMSYNRTDTNGVHWSPCSQLAMTKYLLRPEAECMKNKPDVGKPYPKILPGKMLSRDEQCKRSLGAGAFSDKEQESNCAVLHCRFRFRPVTESRPPAEGSYCGEGSICLDAQCVKDPTVKLNSS